MSLLGCNLYRNKNNEKSYIINKNQRFKMVTLIKSLIFVKLVQFVQLVYWYPIMIFPTISLSILMFFTENKWLEPHPPTPRDCYLINQTTLVFTPFEISKHPKHSEPYLNCFGTSQLNYTKTRWNLRKNRLCLNYWLVHLYVNEELRKYFHSPFNREYM